MLNELRSIWSDCSSDWNYCTETFASFRASLLLDNLSEEDVDSLCSFIHKIKDDQDTITIKVFYDEESVEFSNNSESDNIINRNEELKEYIDNFDGREKLSVELNIYKKHKYYNDGSVIVSKIYSLNTLSSFLAKLTLGDFHKAISSAFYKTDVQAVVFVGDFCKFTSTDYFFFVPNDEFDINNISPKFDISRAKNIKKYRASLGHFSNASEWVYLPDNFKFLNVPSQDMRVISSLFNGIHNAYLISCFSNLSIIENKTISFRINGLKDITGSYDFNALKCIDSTYLWLLYKWVYDGSTVDKMGVVRNIISLHVEDPLSVDEPVLSSSYSSFILLQKNDVKNYIDVTKKLASEVLVTSQKAGDVADKIANTFKNGIFGVATFAISTVLFRIFSKGNDIKSYSDLLAFIGSPLFTSVIGIALVIFSALFGVSLIDSFKDQARFKDMYEHSKKIYQYVLTNEDMKNILNDDSYFKDNYQFISKRRCFYVIVWLVVIAIVALTLILSHSYV